MKQNRKTLTTLLITGLILLAVAMRVINTEMHWWGFAPMVGIGLFSGALIKNKAYAYLLPFVAYLASDLAIQWFTSTNGFYGTSQVFVYGALLLIVLLGTHMGQPKASRVLGFTLGGTAIFWLVSNLGVFASGAYGYSFSGFVTTYLLALPFYTEIGTQLVVNAILGDLLFSGLLFGLYAIAANRLHLLQEA